MKTKIYEAKLKFWGRICFLDSFRWAKVAIMSSIYDGWESKWLKEITEIRREVDVVTMCGIFTYKQWCSKVEEALCAWEKKLFLQAKGSMKSLMWYNTPFNEGRKTIAYVDGSNEAKCSSISKREVWF